MSKSSYLANKWLAYYFRGEPFPRPATVYMGLYSAMPTDSTAGTELKASTAPGYARVPIPNTSQSFPSAQGGVKRNGTRIDFPAAEAAWPPVVGFGLFDGAGATANLLFYGDVTPPLVVESLYAATFLAQGLTFSDE